MIIYFIVFAISCLLIKLSENRKKLGHNILICIALLLPCLLAALRAFSVGTDVQTYVKPLFDNALSSSSYSEYLNASWYSNSWKLNFASDIEWGFRLLVYAVAKIGGSMQLLLFIIQAIIIIPIYKGLKLVDKDNVWFGMLVFYLMFYNISLNAIRQFMAISLIFWGICLIIENKNKKRIFFFLLIIAFLFHTSAILGIVTYAIYFLLSNSKKERNYTILKVGSHRIPLQKIYTYFLILAVICVVLFPNTIVFFLKIIGLDNYSNYIEGNVHFIPSTFIIRLPIIILLIIYRKKLIDKLPNGYFYIYMFTFDFILAQFASVSIYSQRIGYIFALFNIILLPYLSKVIDNSRRKKFVKFLLILYLVAYWYYNFVTRGRGATVPYIFYK